ncbi:MAG TPA: FtsX-like permease family protein, partial [Acidobacteriota bacterium]|nr:FtsX-like permease family protein [Acidobacteriota bacterium]
GRTFNASDVLNGPRVAIINETMARTWWPGQSPIGRRFLFGNPPAPDAKDAAGQPVTPNWITVVGVVKDTRRLGPDSPVRIESWLPVGQRPARSIQLVVRTALPPEAMARTLRETIWSLDRDLPVPRIEPVADLLSEQTAQRRLNLVLVGAFAALALILAAIGLYGVMAYSVSQRTGEFGIRLALGAAPADVQKLVLTHAIRLIALGLGLGVAFSVAVGAWVESLLYGISARDTLTYVGVVGVLGIAALLAAWLPARRAAKVDPMVALRTE